MVTNITMPTATPHAASTAPVSAIPTVPASAIPTAPTPVLAIFIAPILVGPSMFFFLLSPSSFLQYEFIHLAPWFLIPHFMLLTRSNSHSSFLV